MPIALTSPANSFLEPPTLGASGAPIPAVLQFDAPDYVIATTGPADAACIDWHGDAADYEVIILSDPLVIIDTAGDLEVASSGTPAAILVDDAGGLLLSTDLTATPAGAFYAAANGDPVPVRFDAPTASLIQIGAVTRLIVPA